MIRWSTCWLFGLLMVFCVFGRSSARQTTPPSVLPMAHPVLAKKKGSLKKHRPVKRHRHLTRGVVLGTIPRQRLPKRGWVFVKKSLHEAAVLSGTQVLRVCPCSVGSGRHGSRKNTPEGWHRITTIVANPAWNPSPSLRRAVGLPSHGVFRSSRQDARNQLGAYWLAMDGSNKGLHGSNKPKEVGGYSYGCVAFRNPDITFIAKHLAKGTPVVYVAP